jgi:hypothetical protein
MRPRKVSRRRKLLESLEQRLCLAVDVNLTSGLLAITGDADGALKIDIAEVTVDNNPVMAVTVADNGAAIGAPVPLTDLTSGMQIKLGGTDAGADDDVSIDLGGQSVPRITADLGSGNNNLTVSDGTVAGSLTVRSGSGNDTVHIASDATINGLVTLALGGGANAVAVDGDAKFVLVLDGNGDDSITIGETAAIDRLFASLGSGTNNVSIAGVVSGSVDVAGGRDADTLDISGSAGSVFALLGSGDNLVTISGDVTKSAIISGGNGGDTIDISGDVGGQVLANLGGGTNSLSLAGAVGGNVGYTGGQGKDTLNLAATATVGGNVVAHLAGGENAVTQLGAIGNNLLVVTTNPDDAPRIQVEGSVAGQTLIRTSRPKLRDLFDRLRELFN